MPGICSRSEIHQRPEGWFVMTRLTIDIAAPVQHVVHKLMFHLFTATLTTLSPV